MEHKQRYGVEPVDAAAEGLEPPYCPHGPTLVFERYYADREPRQFFACAVHRDRKGCSFFHWVDQRLTAEKRARWRAQFEVSNPSLDRSALSTHLAQVRASPAPKRLFCSDCASLSLSVEGELQHAEHRVQRGVSDEELRTPSSLLTPLHDRKAQAQFHFSPTTTEFIVSELKRLNVSDVICVGTPSLHEVFLHSSDASSLLLDIDHRYGLFYPPEQFLHFNMFNCFFYESDGLEHFRAFLQSSKNVAIVVDPPFGGLARVLAKGLEGIYRLAGRELSTLLVFPYYLEEHVLTALPTFSMSDYQVTYRNHKSFGEARKTSKPSPVRIFTNLPPPGLKLPSEEHYKFCEPCNRYVSGANSHCSKCDACPSKDGRSYRHCDDCGMCVKPGRAHCAQCHRCELPAHECETARRVGCHVCGSLEHKRRDCPEKLPPGGGGEWQARSDTRKQRRKRDSGHEPKFKALKIDAVFE